MKMSDLERIAQLRNSDGSCFEKVVRFRRDTNRPSLNMRVLICEEAKIEMPWLLPVQSETVHTLCRVGREEILEE